MEHLAVPIPRPDQSKEVVVENNETKVASELHGAEKRRYASWIRGIRIRLQLILQKKPPILEALSHSDTASQVVSNSTSNTTSRSHAQNLPEDQWIKEVSVSLPGVYSLPGSNIFVALPTEIPVPRGAEEVFERKVRTLLAADLSEARKYVEAHSVGSRDPNSYIFQPAVLRMSGRASGGPDGTVKLSPTIWVRCSSEQHESMRKVLQKKCMKWAHTTEFGEIQVADAARLLSGVLGDSQIPASTGMALDGLEDTTLHLEIEDHHANIGSYTGYLCRATVMRGSAILSQSLSRIGGFITVDGSPLGLTSAHSMLAVVWDQLSTLVSKQNQTQDGCSVPENHAGERPENMSTFQADADANGTTASGEGSPADDYSRFNEYCYNSPEATKAKEAKWIKAELGGAANFLGIKAIPVTAGQNNTVSSIILLKDLLRSDFALVKPCSSWKLRSGDPSQALKGLCTATPVPTGPVEIYAGGQASLEGYLLEMPATLEILGESLSTRVVQLAQPLPIGSSGSWVVRDEELCGVIIAGYDAEPFAHMIPTDQLVAAIQASTAGKVGLFLGHTVDTDAPQHKSQAGSEPPSNLVEGDYASSSSPALFTDEISVTAAAAAEQNEKIMTSPPAVLLPGAPTATRSRPEDFSSLSVAIWIHPKPRSSRRLKWHSTFTSSSPHGPKSSLTKRSDSLPMRTQISLGAAGITSSKGGKTTPARKFAGIQDPEIAPHPAIVSPLKSTALDGARLLIGIVALGSIAFLVAMERYMIFITFPRIASDFHSLSDIAWYISPYYITSCTGNFLWGRLYSIYHVRPVFLLGAVIFAAGVSISGSAPSTIPFVIGRFLTGLGAPALLSGCMSMLLTITPHKKRQAIETVYSMTYGAFGPLAGLLISGILTDFVTWRWCFWLPLPIGFVAIFVIFVYLRVAIPPPERERVAQREQINRLQLPSVFFFLVANILLLLALQWGSADFEWSNYRIIFLFASAGVAMAVFGALQIHYGDKALVVLRLVRQRSIACAILTSLCTGGCQSFILACASIWARVIQNATALRSGAALLPMAFALSAGALLASHITRKINYFVPVMIGSAAISSIAIGLLTSLQVDPGYDTPIGLLALFGFGIGAGQVIPDLIIKTVAEGTDVSIAVNIAFSASELGGAIFVPVGLAIFNTYFRSALQFYGDAVPPLHQDFPSFAISFLLQSAAGPGGGDFEHAERIVENLILQLFNDSLRKGLYVALALSAAALVTALGSKWTRLKKRAEPDLEIQMAPKTTS